MPSSMRSSLFDEYLRNQPAARRKELAMAEKEYAAKHNARLADEDTIFQQCMYGPGDPIVIEARVSDILRAFLDTPETGNGDWSWKPWRYAKDPGHIFTDEEIEALYPGRVYTPSARPPA